jgi:hypothetical protein
MQHLGEKHMTVALANLLESETKQVRGIPYAADAVSPTAQSSQPVPSQSSDHHHRTRSMDSPSHQDQDDNSLPVSQQPSPRDAGIDGIHTPASSALTLFRRH